MKNMSFLSENFQFLEVKFSIYLNRHVFVMRCLLLVKLKHFMLMPLLYNWCYEQIRSYPY